MIKQFRTEIKWAVYYSIFLLLWMIVERITGLHDKYIDLQQNISMFLLIPTVVFYVLQLIKKNRHFYKGNMTYVQGFFSGVIFTLCIMLLTPVVQCISYYIISPDYFSNLTNYSIMKGIYTKEQAAQQFNYGNFLFINEVFLMLTGVVFAAFVPLYFKIDKRNNDEVKKAAN